jgi:hypothetical protein
VTDRTGATSAAASSTAANSAQSPGGITLGINGIENENSVGEYVNISGRVSGLWSGEMIWTFVKFVSGHAYYPGPPCSTGSGTWTCDYVHVGPVVHGLGSYQIFVVAVDEEEISDIMGRLTCGPSEPGCSKSFPSLPGEDSPEPQSVRVTRTH